MAGGLPSLVAERAGADQRVDPPGPRSVQILVTAGLVDHKKIACYEHVKFEVEACGGFYVSPQEAIKDGRIITGKTWQSHPEFYGLVFSCLESSDEKTADAAELLELS